MKHYGLLLLIACSLAANAGPKANAQPPAWPPADAYLALEPNPSMQGEAGERWYYQDVLLIRGEELRLERSPVSCKDGEMAWSASDGGFPRYVGTLSGSGANASARMTLTDCEYCDEAARTLQLPYARVGLHAVRLGAVTYVQGITQEQLVCPAQ